MPWIMSLHIIFMVMWFAGLFYLPRLFVYHAACEDAPGDERFKVMERKLYIITNIGFYGALLFGLMLVFGYAWDAYSNTGWFWVKAVMVVVLIAYHFYCGHLVKVFRDNRNTRSHRFYRMINEIPVLPLFVVVFCVIAKPF
ncbi:MAG: CopD family protein [Gammaproteobacteria bacterium]|nr:CopD family protein [Gammaproteobacteria bacterium]